MYVAEYLYIFLYDRKKMQFLLVEFIGKNFDSLRLKVSIIRVKHDAGGTPSRLC